jgi:hypothetical protein
VTPSTAPAPSPNRRRFLQRLLVAGGSIAAVSVTGPLVAPAPAGTATTVRPDASGERSPFDDYHPDFSSGDPDTAIQAAIENAASRGGGTVVLPAGEYPLGADLVLPSNVTLRGMSWSGTRLLSDDGSSALVIEEGAEGVSVETLTAPAIRFGASASYCVLRRVRVLDAPSDAVILPTERAHHISVEQLTIEAAGGDGIRHVAPDAQGVFLSEVAITGFGAQTDDARGIRVASRAHLSQIHVEPVGDDQVGIGFEAGSDYSTLTNFTMVLDGGTAVAVEPEDLPVAQGVGAVR